jgi:RNA polymerase sigma factor (sigma-70 family)
MFMLSGTYRNNCGFDARIDIWPKMNNFLILKRSLEYTRDNGQFIHKIIRFHLGDTPEVDDVFQSFFLRLLEKPIPKKEVVNERSYLYRMITNNIVDDVRRTRAYKKHISKYSTIPYHNSAYNPCEKLIQEEDINATLNAIEKHLPAHVAEAVKLRYKENYSNDQIANAVSAKKRTIVKYISDGLKKLREVVNKNHHGKP